MTHPRSLGVDALVVDEGLFQDSLRTLFRSVIQEALRRGARGTEVNYLRQKYLWMRQMRALSKMLTDGDLSAPMAMGDPEEDSWTRDVVDEETMKFDWLIDDDMQRISKSHWDGWFNKAIQGSGSVVSATAFPGPVQDSDDYRYRIRPLYYAHGYTDPADFLSKQVEYTLLGKQKLKTWMHEDLAKVLDRTPRILNGWAAGLADSTVKEVESVNGLQIRVVKGTEVLSNHAFGCAIDVNALGNPHVVGSSVIDVFNWVVRRAGTPFDFGKTMLTESERGHNRYTADDVMELQNRARPASDAVRAWLQVNLPRYRQIMAQVQISEKTLGIMKVAPNTTLANRYKNAEGARNRMQAQAEKNAGGSAPAAGEGPEDAALGEIESAFQNIAQDEDLSRIQILYENFDISYINTWEKQGVMGIPLYLAAALVGELGLQWGEQYEGSKDAMHFELVGNKGISHVAANAPLSRGEKPRTLKRLLDDSFQSKIPKFKL